MGLVLPAIPFRQHSTQMYVAVIHLSALKHFVIDTWNPKNVVGRRGYQRTPDETRIKSIVRYLERKNAIMPVAGLLNIRERNRAKFSKGNLIIPDGAEVWVVDMQHRLKGLDRAREDGVLPGDRFRFPVVITEGLSQIEEAAQFYVINTKSKKMDVALTRRLLIENARVKDLADVKPWEIAAVRITIDLNKSISSNPWYGTIRQPNEERQGQHVATEKSFVSSLRQLLIPGRHKQPHKVAKRLANYWAAIRENIPEAFQEPKRFLVQKTPGMFAFNFFIAPMMLAKNDRSDRFTESLRGLKRLGPDFWRGSNKRGARRFGTGMGGYANLADYVKKHLR
jgi:DGQHR domain-containing protein